MKRFRFTTTILLLVWAFPVVSGTSKDENPRHLIYLHGRIVQAEQNPRPEHPEYGVYEMEKILDAFREHGFVVHGEIRPRSATVTGAADQVVEQIRGLLKSGVPAERITVVGGSMGGAIALLVSIRLQNGDVRFCVLGTCVRESVQYFVEIEEEVPHGRILSIREASDELTGSCPRWEGTPVESSPFVVQEIVIETGLRHGFLYTPLSQWMVPVLEWARRDPVQIQADQP